MDPVASPSVPPSPVQQPRPRLTPAHRSAALRAGAIAGAVSAAGMQLACLLALIVGTLGVLQVGAIGLLGLGGMSAADALFGAPPGWVLAVGIGIAVLSLGAMVGGPVWSTHRLRAAGLTRPVAVSLGGVGVQAVVTILLPTVLATIAIGLWLAALIVVGSVLDETSFWGLVIGVMAVTWLVGTLVTTGVGVLGWWWAAHLAR